MANSYIVLFDNFGSLVVVFLYDTRALKKATETKKSKEENLFFSEAETEVIIEGKGINLGILHVSYTSFTLDFSSRDTMSGVGRSHLRNTEFQ